MRTSLLLSFFILSLAPYCLGATEPHELAIPLTFPTCTLPSEIFKTVQEIKLLTNEVRFARESELFLMEHKLGEQWGVLVAQAWEEVSSGPQGVKTDLTDWLHKTFSVLLAYDIKVEESIAANKSTHVKREAQGYKIDALHYTIRNLFFMGLSGGISTYLMHGHWSELFASWHSHVFLLSNLFITTPSALKAISGIVGLVRKYDPSQDPNLKSILRSEMSEMPIWKVLRKAGIPVPETSPERRVWLVEVTQVLACEASLVP